MPTCSRLGWSTTARVKNYQPGPMYYSVSQQLVYRVGQYRPRSLATVNENQLTIAPGTSWSMIYSV